MGGAALQSGEGDILYKRENTRGKDSVDSNFLCALIDRSGGGIHEAKSRSDISRSLVPRYRRNSLVRDPRTSVEARAPRPSFSLASLFGR